MTLSDYDEIKNGYLVMISCYISRLIVSFKIGFMNNCVNWSHLLKDVSLR
jgi:hypothetical protein